MKVVSSAIGSLIISQRGEVRKCLAQLNFSGVMSMRVIKLNQLTGMSHCSLPLLGEGLMCGAKNLSHSSRPCFEKDCLADSTSEELTNGMMGIPTCRCASLGERRFVS